MVHRVDFRYNIDQDFFTQCNDKKKCLENMFENINFGELNEKYPNEKLTMMIHIDTFNGEQLVLYKFVCAGNFTDRITDYIVANYPNFRQITNLTVYSGHGGTFEVYETDVKFPHKLEHDT